MCVSVWTRWAKVRPIERFLLLVCVYAIQQTASCCLVRRQKTVRNAMSSLATFLVDCIVRSRAHTIYTNIIHIWRTSTHQRDIVGWFKATIVSFHAVSQLSDIVLKRRSWDIAANFCSIISCGIASNFKCKRKCKLQHRNKLLVDKLFRLRFISQWILFGVRRNVRKNGFNINLSYLNSHRRLECLAFWTELCFFALILLSCLIDHFAGNRWTIKIFMQIN